MLRQSMKSKQPARSSLAAAPPASCHSGLLRLSSRKFPEKWRWERSVISNMKETIFEVEVSLEGNPGDMLGRAPGLQTAGVTRVSVGVQALSDGDLKLLNRDHNVKEALQAVEESLKVFPKSTSADLIFGRPHHTLEVWLDELRTLVRLGLPHLSMYQLTIERGTLLWHQVIGYWVVIMSKKK